MAAALLAAAAGYLAVGELSHAWAHGRGLPPGRRNRAGDAVGRREAIIVLGYPSRPDGSPHPLQHWRARIAARSISPSASATTIICTGAAIDSERSEAAVLADLLCELGVPPELIVLEERARSTWQNMEFAALLVADAEVIKVASNSLHAWRARRFLRRQDLELARRLAAADDYRFGEYWWLKTPLAIYEAVGQWREWRYPRLPDASPPRWLNGYRPPPTGRVRRPGRNAPSGPDHG